MRTSIWFVAAIAASMATVTIAQDAPRRFGLKQDPTLSEADSGSPGATLRSVYTRVKVFRTVDIPSGVDGRLTDLKFEEGDIIEADQLLATVDDKAVKLAVQLKEAEERVAKMNAANDINRQDAENAQKVSEAEASSYNALFKKRATSYWEWMAKDLQAKRDALRVTLAAMQQKIAEAEYVAKRSEREMAEYEVARREIKAPFGGYIEKRLAELGGWVQAGTPIATIVYLDRLRVEGDIDALSFPGRITKGAPVNVLVFNRGRDADPIKVSGLLGFVSSELDTSGNCRVWVDIENKRIGDGDWIVKPGMEAIIEVLDSGQVF